MPMVSAEVEVSRPVADVFRYLRDRYTSSTFRSVCMKAKGYVPECQCLEERENEHLVFWVAGRDGLLRFRISGWKWTYDLVPVGSDETRVAITYRWSPWVSLLSMFTARGQAANELTETALALDALAANKSMEADQ